jgi:hypothetical protein
LARAYTRGVILRLAYAAAAMGVIVVLLKTGKPLAGLFVVPMLAIWLRHKAESGELARIARRAVTFR